MPSSACDWSSDVCSSDRSEEHTSELQSRSDLVCRLLLEKKKHTSELLTRLDTSNKQPGLLHVPGLGHCLRVVIFTRIRLLGFVEWMGSRNRDNQRSPLGQCY